MGNPVALITGAGRKAGIAVGIARSLAQKGWDLALAWWTPYDKRMPWGVEQGEVGALVEELSAMGARVFSHACDLERADAAAALFEACKDGTGPLSALVLSHCESVNSGVLDTSVESLDRHFAVNVRASLQLIQLFAAQIPASGGSMVALTSDDTVGNVPYGANKAALDRIVLGRSKGACAFEDPSECDQPRPYRHWLDERGDTLRVSETATLREAGYAAGYRISGGVFVFRRGRRDEWATVESRWRILCPGLSQHACYSSHIAKGHKPHAAQARAGATS